jgi:hypothetical protein
MNKCTIAAFALAAGLLAQNQGFAQGALANARISAAIAAGDSEAAAHESWRGYISENPRTDEGCSQVSYPNFSWEDLGCKETQPRVHTQHVKPKNGEPATVGNGNDYIAQAQGLISNAYGFLLTSGVTSETAVGVASFGGGGILGSNEYMIQINTNNDRTTSVCNGHSQCHVWQQFIYATDYNTKGEAALFIQYWLLDWNATCPSGWYTSASGSNTDCYKNSKSATVPNIPVANLTDVSFYSYVTAGGNDTVTLTYGTYQTGFQAWTVTASDSVLDMGSVWHQAEFNVVGDADGSEAVFNAGSSITVQLELVDGSQSAPTCVGQIATTGETNNLNLGPCQAEYVAIPYIEYTESLVRFRIPVGPISGLNVSLQSAQ